MQHIAINGFGRIGRNILRAWFERSDLFHFTIVAINDIADIQTLAHLLKYDTTHGIFHAEISIEHDYLIVATANKQLKIKCLQNANPLNLTWYDLNVDVVLECTGHFRSKSEASKHLQAGANRVIIGAAPFDHVDITVVYGVNHHHIRSEHKIISSASCTTQALVPLIKLLDDHFTLESALMTEIHAVTADQCVLDQAHRDLRRARASGHNIIPTTSSAIGALKQVLPHLKHRVDGYSIRVPTINVAAIDLTFTTQNSICLKQLHQYLFYAKQHQYHEIMDIIDIPLVSSDFNHSPYSLIVDLTQTMVINHQAKIFAWYDNEWGYTNRLLDLCKVLSLSSLH